MGLTHGIYGRKENRMHHAAGLGTSNDGSPLNESPSLGVKETKRD